MSIFFYQKEFDNMKTYSMPYVQFEDINMLILDKILLQISSDEEIRRAVSRDKKLGSFIKSKYQWNSKESISIDIVEEITRKIPDYFNSFSYLVDCFLNTYEKKYRDVVQCLLETEEDIFLTKLNESISVSDYSIDQFITMIRFYNKNDKLGKRLELILGDELLMKNSVVYAENPKTNNNVNEIRFEINKLIDQLVDSNEAIEEANDLLREKEEELASIIKSYERKQKTLEKKTTKLADENEALKLERLDISKQRTDLKAELKDLEKMKADLQEKNDILTSENKQYKQNLDKEKKKAQQQIITEKDRLTVSFDKKLEAKNQEILSLNQQLETMKEQLIQKEKQLSEKPVGTVVTPVPNRLAAVGLNTESEIEEDEGDDFISLFDIEENRPSI